jgi:hypothetical protein
MLYAIHVQFFRAKYVVILAQQKQQIEILSSMNSVKQYP